MEGRNKGVVYNKTLRSRHAAYTGQSEQDLDGSTGQPSPTPPLDPPGGARRYRARTLAARRSSSNKGRRLSLDKGKRIPKDNIDREYIELLRLV